MNILMGHNFYQLPGGEDRVFADETRLLEDHGHQVERYTAHNSAVGHRSAPGLTRDTLWNGRAARAIQTLVAKRQARVAHFHNTFPLISPAAYYGARAGGAVVVQTLHNFRLLCPQATFFRDGRVCEDCLGRIPWPAVAHACYRGSRGVTAVAAAAIVAHRMARTWRRAVDVYIAVTEFARRKFIAGGLPAEKIVVKPNFVSPTPPAGDGAGGYAVFVGRLSPEKGIPTLLAAWRTLGERIPLKIVGDGPTAPLVREAAATNRGVEWLGPRSADEVQAIVRDAAFLVLPSTCYEGLPKVLVEAFATGTPAVVSRLGALAELVDDGRTGVCFQPGDPVDLADRVSELLSVPSRLSWMRAEARAEFELKYTARRNYELLMNIYERALAGSTRAPRPSAGAESPASRPAAQVPRRKPPGDPTSELRPRADSETPGEAVCSPNR
ncbi:MAG TPA: glycosyltransferase family 4 protein [Pirellulales bacterium]|nr:glycosyltransferase family 4 protein [Pirellulales bacterium]